MRVGVATIQHGRRLHLARQAAGVARSTLAPAEYVVVSMDPVARDVPGARVVHLPVPDGAPLPLAAARNAAIDALGDVELAILLDVDCIPAPGLTRAYADAADDALLIGPVGYLPPMPDARVAPDADDLAAADAKLKRPLPRDAVAREPRHELFWSLSFAVRPEVHRRIGGFDEAYVGYGAEDTDYAMHARDAGVELRWVRDARAHHQHHGPGGPTDASAPEVLANATRFHARHGWWPMQDWLRRFADEGLIEWRADRRTRRTGNERAVAG